MAAKVPKFGAWEGGADKFTINFDVAREIKQNGQKITPNNPEENPETQKNVGLTQTAPYQNKPNRQRKQTTVPHFGDWENGENINYTGVFENTHKNKNCGPHVVENVPQMNRDMPPRADPTSRTQTAKPETREGRSSVPTFGDWESVEGGGAGYTKAFDKLDKKRDPKSKEPQNVGPPPQGGPATTPEFGAWNEGNVVRYTDDFSYLKRPKNPRPGVGVKSTEPQLNQDVGDKSRVDGDVSNKGQRHPDTKPRVDRDVRDKGRPHPVTKPTVDRNVGDKGRPHPETEPTAGHDVGEKAQPKPEIKLKVELEEDGLRNASKGSTYSVTGSEHTPLREKPSSKARLPVDQKGRIQRRMDPARGNPAVTPHGHELAWTTMPAFGGWHKDPSKAEGYTGDFIRAREERKTPLIVPQPYKRDTHYSDKPQPGCCSIL